MGVRRNFACILANVPEKYVKQVAFKKKLFMSNRAPFHVNSGAIIFKSKRVGRHFCSDFQGVLEGSQRFSLDFSYFHQIKTFGGVLPTPLPTPVVLGHNTTTVLSQYLTVLAHLHYRFRRCVDAALRSVVLLLVFFNYI